MKSVLISIQPKWCELIASGNKTIEVRKTKPTIDTPFKCYIYCTLPKKYDTVMPHYRISNECLHKYHGKIKMGDGLDILCADDYESCITLNGMVIGEFVCDKIIPIQMALSDFYVGEWLISHEEMYQTQLSLEELDLYGRNAKNGTLYGWHISDLVIYDKPKALSEFYTDDYEAVKKCIHRTRVGQAEDVAKHGGWLKGSYVCNKTGEAEWCYPCKTKAMTRPPQSWCYTCEVV